MSALLDALQLIRTVNNEEKLNQLTNYFDELAIELKEKRNDN